MKEFKKILSEIENDKLSGSNTLADQLIGSLALIAPQLNTREKREIISGIDELVKKKPFFGTIHHFLSTLQSNYNWPEVIHQYKSSILEADRNIARQFSSKVKDTCKTFLLHSNSKTVVSAFEELYLSTPEFKIFQTQALPDKEGIIQAKLLMQLGLDVAIIEDDPPTTILEQTDILVTGADLIMETEFINKAGTRLLAEKIRAHGKPFIVLADQRKFTSAKSKTLPSTFEFIPIGLISELITS